VSFTITRTGRLDTTTDLNWTTTDGTALAGTDYQEAAGQVIFAPGDTAKTVQVSVFGDTAEEPDETLGVVLSNVTNVAGATAVRYVLGRSTATGTILNDDVEPVFNFADFSGAASQFNLLSSATITTDNRLRLTPAQGGLIGGGWYNVTKPLVAGYFDTTFQFQLGEGSDNNGTNGSDGFAFVVQNSSPTELRGGGGGLGYSGIPNSLAIEFDTFQNSEYSDPSQSHISVHTGGTGPNSVNESYSIGVYNTPGLLDDAQVHTARVKYSLGTLSVYYDDFSTPVIAAPLDLAATLNLDVGGAWVGFTAATGGGYEDHDILNWSFNNVSNLILADSPNFAEGNTGSNSTVNVTIYREGSLGGSAIVNWATADGTATSGLDYVAASGQITFQDGESQKSIPITIIGDNAQEPNETIKLLLFTPDNYVAVNGQATIVNDDTSVSISDATATEGDTAIRFFDPFVGANNGGVSAPRNAIFGPDGLLYVTSLQTDSILRYDGRTGAFIGTFVTSGTGGLDGPWALAFGPDGNLYVSGSLSNNVLRFAPDGALLDGASGGFVPTGAFGLSHPKGLAFDADGNLYVSSTTGGGGVPGPHQILRFNSAGNPYPAAGQTGAVFVADGNGLSNPNGLAFGPDHNLYVANTFADTVDRFDGVTGASLGLFVTANSNGLDGPNYLAFRPDGLYVTSQATQQILRYDATTGAPAGVVVAAGSGGLTGPFSMAFDSVGNMYVASSNSNQVLRYGPASQVAFTVTLSQAVGTTLTIGYSTANDSAVDGADYIGDLGMVVFAPGETSRTILIGTIDNTTYKATETFTVNLTGDSVADGKGVGTIIDNDTPPPPPLPTRFYVVNDGSPDRTYEYAADGTAVENYAINGGNATPRGAASTSAGTTVWVVDANKNVYVYDTSGGLKGSWAAGSLPASADVQGIATDGTNIWIVENSGHKVYYYAGAASRTSGSQTAKNSFALNSADTSAKDVVTDGSSIWGVDDGTTTDKVFKYNVANGKLQGSWTIDGGGGSPTGITIDPTGASTAVWIVDSATDRVYQFNNAHTVTGGTLTASTSFALAAGNTNPQGIADPPTAVAGSTYNSALLAVIGELDDVLGTGKKRR
jgi:sugar lactone lactonase YvrE